jgi:hypothetical protein
MSPTAISHPSIFRRDSCRLSDFPAHDKAVEAWHLDTPPKPVMFEKPSPHEPMNV